MRACFGRRYMLSASHRLHCDTLTEDQNRAAYGKCNNPHGHGHNYIVEVLVAGPVSPDSGMVINLVDLDAVMQTRILDRFDHANLNLDPLFSAQVPTTENLCREIFRLLRDSLSADPPQPRLEYVRVEETENNFFQCCNL
jgi:6-pyruvoyltetrahydropterin/6-carboxytetrahydropterin synthase